MVSKNSRPTTIFENKSQLLKHLCSISYQLPIFYSTAWSQLTGNSSSHHLPQKMNVSYIDTIQYNTKVQNMLLGVKLQACRCSPKHEGESRELDWPANYRMVTSHKHWVGVSTGSLMQNSARGQRSGISSFHFTTKTTKPPSISCSISYQLPIFYSTAWSQLTGNSSSHHLPRKMNVSYIAMIQHNTKVQNMLPGIARTLITLHTPSPLLLVTLLLYEC